MGLEEEIKRMATDCLAGDHQFLVDVIVTARKGPKKVLVIVDGDYGVSIDDCATISRALGQKLDDSGVLGEENYMLEVSTPGLDQPLKFRRQYVKNVGRRLKVTAAGAVLEGKLEQVGESGITLVSETGTGKKKETKSHEVAFDAIERAFVLVSFK
ncbi:MAG TPA: hypothetical protein VKZ68_11065 [Ohtaekwangia sp.]|nr:hypothetical protein [Ohtaekwangia sp.]